MSEKWEDGLDPKPERLEDQLDINSALEKLRHGVRLTTVKYSTMPELFELKVMKGPDGEDREVIFVYDYQEGLPLSTADTVEYWLEEYVSYAGVANYDLTPDQALEYLKKGYRIVDPQHIYFKGVVRGNMPELEDTEFVFCVYKTQQNSLPENTWISKPLDKFRFNVDGLYGIDG